MNTEEEHLQPVSVKKIKKSTRSKKGTKTDISGLSDTDRTDRISIKRKTRAKVRPLANLVQYEEVYRTYPVPDLVPKLIPRHKERVKTFVRTVCIAGILAYILSDYYVTIQALRRAKVQINELTYIINSSATTRISDKLDSRQSMLQEVGKRMDLPVGEDPTVVLIEDAEIASREQSFYSQVIHGDVVIIYPNAKKAIIWSPSRMKIVNAGVVDIQKENTNNKNTASTTEEVGTL